MNKLIKKFNDNIINLLIEKYGTNIGGEHYIAPKTEQDYNAILNIFWKSYDADEDFKRVRTEYVGFVEQGFGDMFSMLWDVDYANGSMELDFTLWWVDTMSDDVINSLLNVNWVID